MEGQDKKAIINSFIERGKAAGKLSAQDIDSIMIELEFEVEELDKLYVIDPLCNIYNRNGFIRESDPLFHFCQVAGQFLRLSVLLQAGETLLLIWIR